MVTQPTRAREHELLRAGFAAVIGMDEVGRGAIAGPVLVGVAVVTSETGDAPHGLRDSKLLTELARERLAPIVCEWVVTCTGSATATEIDEMGISACLGLAGRRALISLHELGVPVADSVVLLDGSHDWLTPALSRAPRVFTQPKADRDCSVVAGASVVAKVERDSLMRGLHEEAPHFGWNGNKGYGSSAHFAAIDQFGVTSHHRKTWLHRD